jgi:hydrogenase-4 component B
MSGLLGTTALILAPGIPLALGVLWGVPRLRRHIGPIAPWAAVPALLLALLGTPGETVELSWLLFGGYLGLTDTTRVFLFFTALIWFAAGIHGRGHLAEGDHCERFCVFWLFTLAGNIGLIVALDVALFYTSFALMTFAAYGLIVHDQGAIAQRAGRVYLVLAVLGEALILMGLLLAARATAAPLLPMLAELPASHRGCTQPRPDHRQPLARFRGQGRFAIAALQPATGVWCRTGAGGRGAGRRDDQGGSAGLAGDPAAGL